MEHRGNPTKQSTIVVVEDSPTQALNIQVLLRQTGADVVVAVDGIQGLMLVQQVLPDAVILDLEMPGMNGFEVCAELKASPDTKDIPVIMLTRHDTPESVTRSLESGALEFIPKDAFAGVVLIETLRQMNLVGERTMPDIGEDPV